jgi:hypothetical protein
MANWPGTARSNYFRVKDAAAFVQWAERRGLGVFKTERGADIFAFHSGESTGDGSWPSYDMDTMPRSILSGNSPSTFPRGRLPS